jgi:signal transduction histidine kinase/CheY-like chemotaxis protein
MSDEELVIFAEDDEPVQVPAKAWKVAIIDDDSAVHDGTRFALWNFTHQGYGVDLLSAYSAEEGKALIAANPDIAVILLDVVMETENAGLGLVEHIRRVAKNEIVRIILRTGQPGQAPERQVIVDYDINDYKPKTELTADRLFTALTAALRSWRQLAKMEETRRGLGLIVDAATTLYDAKSMQRLAEGVLTQLCSLIRAECGGMLMLREGEPGEAGYRILAGSGVYEGVTDGTASEFEPGLAAIVKAAFAARRHQFGTTHSALYLSMAGGREVVVALDSGRELSETDRSLVELFCGKLPFAFDNVLLYEQLRRANEELEVRVKARTAALAEANERLALQREALHRANDFKNVMLGMVAHELKNPIGVILGRGEILGELLAMDGADLEAMRRQLERMVEPAKMMTRMIEQLLADAMNDAEDIVLAPQRFDLAALTQEVVAAQRPAAEAKSQTLGFTADGATVLIADPDRLREAIENLVSNAIKYTPLGGRIAVSCRGGPEDVRLDVTDDGLGLSPEDRGRLFGRFQRLSAKPTAGEGSTGLGLSITRHIVALHGGSLGAASAGPGQGSTFSIALPRTSAAGADGAGRDVVGPPDGGRRG